MTEEERIDIVLTDKVSDEPARKIKFLGDAARSTHESLKQMRDTLTSINSSAVRKLQEDMTASVTAATRQATAMERLEAAQARTATAVARLEAAQAKTTTAQIEGAVAAQRLATETERTERAAVMTAAAKERLETATRRNTAAAEREGDAAVKLYQANERLIEQARRSQQAATAQAQYNATFAPGLASTGGSARASASVFAEDARQKEQAAKATAELTRATVALKSAADPLYAAQVQYNRTMEESARLLAAGTLTQAEHARITDMATQAYHRQTGVAGQLGDATKLTRFQMLTLQYTMNDVAASLASGASPFTILMQQGGQVTQAWGGLMPTLRAAGAALMTTTGLIATGALVVAGLVYAYDKADASARQYNASLIQTGSASGLSTQALLAMTTTVAKAADVSKGAATDAITAFVSNGTIAGSVIERLSTTTERMQREMGVAVKDSVKQFAELGKEPVEASVKLNASTHYLTVSVYENIKSLQEQGKTAEAAKAAQIAYADAMDDRTKRLAGNLGFLETAWRGVQKAAVWAWDSMLGIGRAGDPLAAAKTSVAAAEDALTKARERASAGNLRPTEQADANARVERLAKAVQYRQQELLLQEKGAAYEGLSAALSARNADMAQTKMEWDKRGAEFADKSTKLKQAENLEVAAGKKLLDEGIITLNEYNKRIELIREKFKEKGPKDKSNAFAGEQEAAKEWARAMEDAASRSNKAQGQLEELTKAEIAYNAYKKSTAFTLNQQTNPAMNDMVDALYQEAIAQEKAGRAAEFHAKNTKPLTELIKKEQEALDRKLQTQLDDNAQMGMTKAQVLEIKAAREEALAVADEEYAQALRMASAYAGEYSGAYIQYANALEEAARKRRELSKAEEQGGVLRAGADAALKAERAWEVSNKKIGDGLYEALSNGGDAAIKRLIKDMKEWFARLVLSPIINPIANFGASLINPTAASAAGSSGFGSLLGNFGGSALSAGGSWLSQFASGFSGSAEAASAMMGGAELTTAASMGSMAAAALPWVAGAMVVKALTDYTITPTGNALTATVGAGGVLNGKVGTRADFTQSSSGILSGGTTHNSTWGVADAGTTAYINQGVQAVTAQNIAAANALGLNADALQNYTAQLEINVTGMDAAAAKVATDKAILQFQADQFASAFGDSLASVTKEGETSAQAAQRLATSLTTVNGVFDTFGYTLMDVSVKGAQAADNLINAFGSMQNFSAQMSSAYSNFYTKDEQKQKIVSGLYKELTALGITTSEADIAGADRATWRKVLDAFGADTGTEAGAKKYAALVAGANKLSPYLDGFASTTQDASATIASAANTVSQSLAGSDNSAASAVKNFTDALLNEAERIRGIVQGDTGPTGYADAQMRFMVATAQARAHDEAALAALPGLSQAMLRLADANELSLADLNYVRSTTMASLKTTAAMNGAELPSFDVGTSYVPYDMTANIHKGEEITPAGYKSETNALLRAILDKLGDIDEMTLTKAVAADERIRDAVEMSLQLQIDAIPP